MQRIYSSVGDCFYLCIHNLSRVSVIVAGGAGPRKRKREEDDATSAGDLYCV
jgi:hypothetical protein